MALTDLTRISTSGIATGSTIDAPILRKDVSFRGSQVGVVSALFDSSDDALEFGDNVKLRIGARNDLTLFHNASDSVITHSAAGEGNLKILSGGAQSIECVKAGAVNITHNGSTKIETTTHGAVVTGVLTATSFSGGISGDSIGNVYAASGISTFYDLRVSNNLTVQGTTTTLDTNLIGVDRVEVGADSDTNVAIAVTQSGAADLVNLFDGATKVVTVDDEGRVGIGSDAPESLLQVNNSSGAALMMVTASTQPRLMVKTLGTTAECRVDFGDIGDSSRGAIGYNNAADALKFYTSGVANERLRITSGGQVNIGTGETTQTARMLNVYGGATRVTQTSGGNTIEAFGHTTSGQSYGLLVNAGSTSGDYCANFRNSSGTALFRIRGDGNIGIGTDSPDGKLDVRGTIFVNGDGTGGRIFASGGNLSLTDGNGRQTLRIDDPGSGNTHTHVFDSNGRLGIGTHTPATQLHLSGATPIIRITDTDTEGPLHTNIDGASGYLTLDVGSVHRDVIITSAGQANEIARFEGDGNVGIGTNDPECRMHLLAGNDRACVRLHNTYDTPDNVFELQPGISGVTNTGFCIRDITDSANRFVIDGSGQVGIGTNVPTYQLQVHHSNPGGLLRLLSSHEGDYDLRFVYQNSETNIWSYASSDMTFGTRYAKKLHLVTNGPGKRLTIDDGGNVGIGSVNPAAKLDVNGRVQINYSPTEANAGTVLTVKGSQADTSSTVNEQYKNSPIKVVKTISQTQLRGGLIDGWDDNIHGVGIAMRYDGTRYHMSFGVNNDTNDRPTERMTIAGNGDIEINDGDLLFANGHGISFVNNTDNETGGGSVSAEVLDDYEEGSWNPTLDSYGGGGTGGVFTYTAQHGAYTKIGRYVACSFYVAWSAMTTVQTGTYATISGLPFTVGSHAGGGNNGASEGNTMNINWIAIPGNGVSGRQLTGFPHRTNSRVIMGYKSERSISAATPDSIHTSSTYSGSYYLYGEVSYYVD